MKRLLLILLMCFGYSQSDDTEVGSVRIKRQDLKDKRIVCYYANWAPYRTGEHKFTPEDIHPSLCTHVLYAFATLEEDVGIVPFDSNQDIELGGYKKFIELKKTNPDLKLMLSLGGTKEGPARFSKMAADPKLRKDFAKTSRAYLMQFGFDGLDLVWQYPAFFQGSSSSDKENYVHLVKELKMEFKNDLGLSMAVPSLEKLIDVGFDLPELAKYLDFMNILTYNYHEATEPAVNHVAPLFQIKEDPFKELNVDATIQIYKKKGVDLSKFTMGIPLYGVSFFLEDAEETDIGSSTSDEGEGNQERGAISYNVLCKLTKEELWTIRHVNKSAVGPYAYKDKRWVGYDDEDMVRTKARYAAEKNLGGLMFWTIDMDDFKGMCGSRAYPLIKAGRESFLQRPKERNPSTPSKVGPTPIPPTKAPTKVPETKPCPTGTRGTQPNCTPIEPKPCPPGTRGTQPNCTPIKVKSCPPGTRGTQPNCTPNETKPNPPISQPNPPNFNVDKNFNPNFSDNSDTYPEMNGTKQFYSNRDIIFQNIKIFVSNNHYNNKAEKK